MKNNEMTFSHEQIHRIQIDIIAPNGLGFGEGSISASAQLKSGELSPEAYNAGLDILQHDNRVVQPIDSDAVDDGCGDGRPAAAVYCVEGGERKYFNKSRRRAKVFGGGLVAFTSMQRSVAQVLDGAEPTNLASDHKNSASNLRELKILYGAHTDTHAHGDNCGCGAIDKYPLITANALAYRQQITDVVELFYNSDKSSEKTKLVNAVFESYKTLASSTDYFAGTNGKVTMDYIESDGAVIKQLSDNHLEDYVFFNEIEDTTFDQRKFDEIMKERGIDSTAQVFAVDMWRGRMYADAAAKLHVAHAQDAERYQQACDVAFVDFIIRTAATAATLTDGSLPVAYARAV
ncbi:hypothetical protein FJZ39_02480 [Candidatus Saccharibacteria bacterium]|nr:hypothetical protein [Candidatus Saccharibacteria bacterium]